MEQYKKLPIREQIRYWQKYLDDLIDYVNSMSFDTVKEQLGLDKLTKECRKVMHIISVLQMSAGDETVSPLKIESSINKNPEIMKNEN